MEPEGEARGVAVLLHGLTDSPYSLQHIARRYRDLGYVAVAIRLPAHGTVPGALTEVRWEKMAGGNPPGVPGSPSACTSSFAFACHRFFQRRRLGHELCLGRPG